MKKVTSPSSTLPASVLAVLRWTASCLFCQLLITFDFPTQKVMLLVAAFLFFLPLGIHSHNEPDLWPKGIVKYHFDKTFSPENKTFMEDVLHKLGQKLEGCIMFKHSKSGNYIHVDTKYPCSSGLGYWGNSQPGEPQPMSLDPIHCTPDNSQLRLLWRWRTFSSRRTF